jgi:membrane-bound lytic murein transglycosylase B
LSIYFLLLSLAIAIPNAHAESDFPTWLQALKDEALAKGIKPATLEAATPHFTLTNKVSALEKKQPEFTQTLAGYLGNRISDRRIQQAREQLRDNRSLLDSISTHYGVPARFIVALWAMESDFGRNMGGFSVLSSLTTLGFQSRRADYFRRELLEALRICDAGHVTPDSMLGSWAGAMGQCQFMPWNFNRYAVDYDGDGRRDIWHTRADVFASIAHFLQSLGWDSEKTWGRPVHIPADFNPELVNGKTSKSLAEWQELGVRRLNNGDLPKREISARLLRPARSSGRAYLIYSNFDVFLKWNRSHYFAIAAGTLGDEIR